MACLTFKYLPPKQHSNEVRVTMNTWDEQGGELIRWIGENIGSWNDGDVWDFAYDHLRDSVIFYFYYEHNAVAFKLAWL